MDARLYADARGVGGILLVVLFGNLLAFNLYMTGVKLIGPEKSVLYGFSEPGHGGDPGRGAAQHTLYTVGRAGFCGGFCNAGGAVLRAASGTQSGCRSDLKRKTEQIRGDVSAPFLFMRRCPLITVVPRGVPHSTGCTNVVHCDYFI